MAFLKSLLFNRLAEKVTPFISWDWYILSRLDEIDQRRSQLIHSQGLLLKPLS
jgi:hypothetical protein